MKQVVKSFTAPEEGTAASWLSELQQIVGVSKLNRIDIEQRVTEHIKKCYVLENGPHFRSMFFLFDNTDIRYLFVSKSTFAVLGYSREEIEQKGIAWLFTLLTPGELDYKKQCMEDIFAFLKTLDRDKILNCIVRYDIEATHCDGRRVHLLEEMMFPEVNAQGEPLITSCFLHDLSSYADEKQRQSNIYLETPDGKSVIFSHTYYVNPPNNILLSQREIQVLQLFSFGLNTRQVAEKLFVTQNTIKSHRKNILFKLNAQNTAEAVKVSMKNNWL